MDIFKNYGTDAVKSFIEKAVYRHFVLSDEAEVRLIPAALLRKFGHQIWSSWAEKLKNEENPVQPSEAVLNSLQISSYIWSSQVQVNTEDEGLKSILRDTLQLWNNILVDGFGAEEWINQNVLKLLLTISFHFKADDIDRISIPVRSSFKRGHDNPELPITALIMWKHIGDVWSIITDWIANFIRDQDQSNRESRRLSKRGIRFNENRNELDIESIMKYIDVLISHEKAYNSAACNDVAEFIFKLEKKYLENVGQNPNSNPKLDQITLNQYQLFMNLKIKIILTSSPSKFATLMNTEPYFSSIVKLSTDPEASANNKKKLLSALKIHINVLSSTLRETVKYEIENDYEEKWAQFIQDTVDNGIVLLPIIKEMLNLFLQLLKRRLYQGIYSYL